MQNGEVLAFIEDGYTQDFFLKSEPNQYPDIRGTYRPMTFHQVQSLNSKLAQYELDHDKRAVLAAETVAQHVQSWDIKDRRGNVQPIDAAFVLKMRFLAAQRIYNIVSGIDSGDVDRRIDEALMKRVHAEASGATVAEQEEAALKN